jgi:hypothetical protein
MLSLSFAKGVTMTSSVLNQDYLKTTFYNKEVKVKQKGLVWCPGQNKRIAYLSLSSMRRLKD